MIKIDDYHALKAAFRCEPETGQMFWTKTMNGNALDGDRAGYERPDGYRYIKYLGQVFLEHRVVWFFAHGTLPNQLDHINMNKADNRICNLRPATNSQNSMNKAKQSNNTSGYKGVYYHPPSKKFNARICKNRKVKSLGSFNTAEEAYEAYVCASKELHGSFSFVGAV